MHSSTNLSCLLLALVPTILDAEVTAQSTKVVPPNLTSVEGESSYYFPFLYDAGRFQQIWDGQAVCAASAVLTQISFRRDTNQDKSAYTSIVRVNTTVSLGVTSVSPATMTTNFTNNLANARLTTLVNAVNYTLPAQPAPVGGPAPFNVTYPMTTPFIFINAQGHLLMEWIVPGSANNKDSYLLDGETQTSGVGYARPFGAFGRFSAGDTPTFSCDATRLIPGGAVALTVSNLKSNYAAAAFFGFSDTSWSGLTLPFDLGLLGATGNTLYTGRTIELPLPTVASGSTYQGQINLPLPNITTFAGYKMFAQTWFADATANGLGIVASGALELTPGNGQAYTGIIGIETSTAANGNFEKGATVFGGPVVQFSGTIN
jgi:hypothetical protein